MRAVTLNVLEVTSRPAQADHGIEHRSERGEIGLEHRARWGSVESDARF